MNAPPTSNTVDVEQIRLVVSSILNRNIDDVSNDQHLFDTGVLDSLNVLDLIEAFEEEFVIQIDTEDLNEKNFATFATLQAMIDSYIRV